MVTVTKGRVKHTFKRINTKEMHISVVKICESECVYLVVPNAAAAAEMTTTTTTRTKTIEFPTVLLFEFRIISHSRGPW